MLSHIFDASEETYKNASMPIKIIYDIISAEANAKFSSEVSHIVSKRNWEKTSSIQMTELYVNI